MDEQDELYDELKEFIRKYRIPQQPLTRRQLLLGGSKLALLLASISAVSGPGLEMAEAAGLRAYNEGKLKLPEMTSIPSYLKGSGQVVLSSWGGALGQMQQVAYVEPFTKLSGIKVIVSGEQPDTSKIKAQVDTGNYTYDVAEIDLFTVLNLNKKSGKSYFEKIDYSLYDTKDIAKADRHEYCVNMLPYSTVFAYRTDVYSASHHPHGAVQFWDTKKFPGRRSMEGGTNGVEPVLEHAKLSTGIPMSKIYPINIDEAFNQLSKIRHSVTNWWDAGQTPAQLLSSKDVVLAQAWNGRVYSVKQAGAPVAVDFWQGMLASDAWAILKGAPNRENAQKFTAFMMLPISQARQGLLIDYGFTNKAAANYIPKSRLAVLPTGPKQLRQQFRFNSYWWADNVDTVLKKWAVWVLGS